MLADSVLRDLGDALAALGVGHRLLDTRTANGVPVVRDELDGTIDPKTVVMPTHP